MHPRQLVIGDIHGCYRTLRRLLESVVGLTMADELYLLGDYIDRGPESRNVIDYIMNLRSMGYKVRTLRGNHDEMMLNAINDPAWFNNWISNGGSTTLYNFRVDHPSQISQEYIQFFNELEYYIELENCYLVHAGFNFNEGYPFSDKHAMLWVRHSEPDYQSIGGKSIFHGHTANPITEIRKKITLFNELAPINLSLDSGCVYFEIDELGVLTCLDLHSMQLYSQQNIDLPV